ncbi:hypothetical protein Lal_00042261 [Lupinus albus]|nr:hypothetical protein Lal_00042261 [Lupinus albus]
MTGLEEEAPANSVPAAAVRRGGQVFFGMTGRKGHSPKTGGMLSKPIHLSETEESGISCVGVKSADLRRKAKSEGSSLGPYRRWSAKAWGANGIRYPGAQLTRETLRLGSTVARPKLKGIDGGLHKRWSMWFNSIQRAKPYQPLKYEKENQSLTRMGWYLLSYRCCMAVSYNERNPRFVLLRHAPKDKVFATEVSRGADFWPYLAGDDDVELAAEKDSAFRRAARWCVRPAKTAPKETKRCMPHSRGTASDILEEGGDDVKSAWPLWAGPHTCYNGNYNGKQGCKAELIRKDCLSSDCSLQLGNMKLESLVIADQHAAVNMYPGPVHTARHTLGIGFARSIGPMITHDFCVPLVPQRLLVVFLFFSYHGGVFDWGEVVTRGTCGWIESFADDGKCPLPPTRGASLLECGRALGPKDGHRGRSSIFLSLPIPIPNPIPLPVEHFVPSCSSIGNQDKPGTTVRREKTRSHSDLDMWNRLAPYVLKLFGRHGKSPNVVPKVDPKILFGSKGGEVIPNSLSLPILGIEGDQPGRIGRQVCNGSKLASKPLRMDPLAISLPLSDWQPSRCHTDALLPPKAFLPHVPYVQKVPSHAPDWSSLVQQEEEERIIYYESAGICSSIGIGVQKEYINTYCLDDSLEEWLSTTSKPADGYLKKRPEDSSDDEVPMMMTCNVISVRTD